MKELSIKYNKTKVLEYLGLSIVFILIFTIIAFNYEYLSHQKPSSIGRHRWVGKLFYENKNLILWSSLFLILFSLLGFFDSLFMLIRGKMELKIENGIIYKNGKYFADQKDISKTELYDYNNNCVILIHFKTLKNIINKRRFFIDKLLIQGFLLINKNRLQLKLSFLENNKKNYKEISEFLMKQKLQIT